MKKGMAVRSDERDVGKCDMRALGDLDGGASKLATEREVERGNRSRADFFIGGSREQFFAKARRVRKSVKRDQARRRTRKLVEFDDGGAHAVMRSPGHQANRENYPAVEFNRDCAHHYPGPIPPIRRRRAILANRHDDLSEASRFPQGAGASRRENRASWSRRATQAR